MSKKWQMTKGFFLRQSEGTQFGRPCRGCGTALPIATVLLVKGLIAEGRGTWAEPKRVGRFPLSQD